MSQIGPRISKNTAGFDLQDLRYAQRDSKYSQHPNNPAADYRGAQFPNDYIGFDFWRYGCQACCIATLFSWYTGFTVTPTDLRNNIHPINQNADPMIEANGSWLEFRSYTYLDRPRQRELDNAKQMGLLDQLYRRIYAEIQGNRPVMLRVSTTPFPSHFVLVYGVNSASANNIQAQDILLVDSESIAGAPFATLAGYLNQAGSEILAMYITTFDRDSFVKIPKLVPGAIPDRYENYNFNPNTGGSVTITWNGNGGTPPTTTQTKTAGGQMAPLPANPTRSGHSFVGWYNTSSQSGGTQITGSTTVPNSNAAYFARWSQNSSGGNDPGGSGAPANLRVTNTTSNTVTLAWNPSAGAVNYSVDREGSPSPLVAASATFTETDLHANTTYRFRVRARFASGFSAYTGWVSATTQGAGGGTP